MLDSYGDIIANERYEQSEIILEADVSDLYVDPLPWLHYNELVIEKHFELSSMVTEFLSTFYGSYSEFWVFNIALY